MTKPYSWNENKNKLLRLERGVSFDDVVKAIESGDLLATEEHPNKEKYGNQKIYIVNIESYVYLVPFVEDEKKIFLKTIYPSRRATKKHLKKD